MMRERDTSGSIKVTVLDEPFAIRSEASAEYTREVARHVDRTLRGLREAVPTVEPFQAAVLGAMEITDELLSARRDHRSTEEALTARVERLKATVDAVLAEPMVWKEAKNRSRKETSARRS